MVRHFEVRAYRSVAAHYRWSAGRKCSLGECYFGDSERLSVSPFAPKGVISTNISMCFSAIECGPIAVAILGNSRPALRTALRQFREERAQQVMEDNTIDDF